MGMGIIFLQGEENITTLLEPLDTSKVFSFPLHFWIVFFLFRWTWPSQVATSTPTSSSRWSPSWSTPGRARSSWGRRERESTIWLSSTASSISCPAYTQPSISLLGLFSGNVVLNTQQNFFLALFFTSCYALRCPPSSCWRSPAHQPCASSTQSCSTWSSPGIVLCRWVSKVSNQHFNIIFVNKIAIVQGGFLTVLPNFQY